MRSAARVGPNLIIGVSNDAMPTLSLHVLIAVENRRGVTHDNSQCVQDGLQCLEIYLAGAAIMHQHFSVSRQWREFRGTGSLDESIQMVIFSSARDGVIMKKVSLCSQQDLR